MRTSGCDPAVLAGRLAKARQFAAAANDVLALAEEAQEVADAFVTLAVHAGIAASDVICCVRLGRYARSERHDGAISLLGSAHEDAAKSLSVLLRMKTVAGYSYRPVSTSDRLRAERAMNTLLEAANSL
jgi:hypothetical protein